MHTLQATFKGGSEDASEKEKYRARQPDTLAMGSTNYARPHHDPLVSKSV